MKRYLLLALGCLLFTGVAAHADSLYEFSGTLSTTTGSVTVSGTFTYNGSAITSWDLDFGAVSGTCGYLCQLGPAPAFTSEGDGFVIIGSSSDSFGNVGSDNSYISYDGGLNNTILAVNSNFNNDTGYNAQLYFNFNAIPGSLDLDDSSLVISNYGVDQDAWIFTSGSATLTPEPPSLLLALSGALMLLAGLGWHERKRTLALEN